jgi:hypothetical protein
MAATSRRNIRNSGSVIRHVVLDDLFPFELTFPVQVQVVAQIVHRRQALALKWVRAETGEQGHELPG